MNPPQNSTLPGGFVRSSRTATLILQPAGSPQSIQNFPQAGVRFYVVESDNDAAIGVKPDKTQEELFTVGTGKEFSEDQPFRQLQITNYSPDVVTITLFAGFGDYIDKRTTIVGNRLTSILPVIEPKTKPIAGAVTSIAGNAAIALSGVPATGQLRRKAIVVSNVDANLNLQILDGTGTNIILTIFPNTSIILPISEACSIKNPNGSALALTYGEIWWMKP